MHLLCLATCSNARSLSLCVPVYCCTTAFCIAVTCGFPLHEVPAAAVAYRTDQRGEGQSLKTIISSCNTGPQSFLRETARARQRKRVSQHGVHRDQAKLAVDLFTAVFAPQPNSTQPSFRLRPPTQSGERAPVCRPRSASLTLGIPHLHSSQLAGG